MSNITIKEIAQALNISISSVSKALNDSHEISEATKKRVLNYARENGYRPNVLAKNLKTGKTNTIGVILSSINNSFCSQVIEGIQQQAIIAGYDVIFMQSREQSTLEKSCIEALQERGIDGLLISPVDETSNLDLLKSLHQSSFPVVIFDRIQHHLETYKIGISNFKGAYLATKHLIQSNRKKIVNITGSKFGLSAERFNGYKQAHLDFNVHFNANYYIQCNMQNPEVLDRDLRKSIKNLMDSDNPPNAILSSSDTITVRVLGVLSELNYRVPEDLAVIGFSNIDFPLSMNPSLSTIRQPALDIGSVSIQKLVYLINKKNWSQMDPETIELEIQLTYRKSTAVE